MTTITNLERRIVSALIDHLAAAGFALHACEDGGEWHAVADKANAIEILFSVGESVLIVRNNAGHKYSVLLVPGNGEDVISDYTDDRGPFSAAMDAFDPETACDPEALIDELAGALRIAVATVELHTSNGAQEQPAGWPRDRVGDIDHEAVAKIGRAALARVAA